MFHEAVDTGEILEGGIVWKLIKVFCVLPQSISFFYYKLLNVEHNSIAHILQKVTL